MDVSLTLTSVAILIWSKFMSTVHGQGPMRCYDCNSGRSSFGSDICPVNGMLKVEILTTVRCAERCFCRTFLAKPGVVQRGCSAGLGFLLERPLPEDGCIQDPSQNWWCFCKENFCNTDDMTKFASPSGPDFDQSENPVEQPIQPPPQPQQPPVKLHEPPPRKPQVPPPQPQRPPPKSQVPPTRPQVPTPPSKPQQPSSQPQESTSKSEEAKSEPQEPELQAPSKERIDQPSNTVTERPEAPEATEQPSDYGQQPGDHYDYEYEQSEEYNDQRFDIHVEQNKQPKATPAPMTDPQLGEKTEPPTEPPTETPTTPPEPEPIHPTEIPFERHYTRHSHDKLPSQWGDTRQFPRIRDHRFFNPLERQALANP